MLKYILKLKTYPDQAASNALYLGTACHTGIQEGIEEMKKTYYDNYYIQSDEQINEMIKLEYLIPKIAALLPDGEAEYELNLEDEYVGFVDWLVEVEPNVYDIYDFKYSNNIDSYMKSAQLHLYKYYFEKCNPTKRIRNLYFVFIPKTQIRQKKTEDLYQFRKRLMETLEAMEITKEKCIKQVVYDPSKIVDFFGERDECVTATVFPKNITRLCDWCEFKDYCQKGSTLEIMNVDNLKGEK
jgi:hypothetical protein